MSETILEGKLSSFTESLIKIVNSNVSLMKIPCKHFHQQHIHRFIRPIPHHTWSLFGLESQLANSSLASYYHSRHVIDQVFVSALCQLLLHITLSSELRNKLSRLQQHNFGSQYKWRPQHKKGSDIISPLLFVDTSLITPDGILTPGLIRSHALPAGSRPHQPKLLGQHGDGERPLRSQWEKSGPIQSPQQPQQQPQQQNGQSEQQLHLVTQPAAGRAVQPLSEQLPHPAPPALDAPRHVLAL